VSRTQVCLEHRSDSRESWESKGAAWRGHQSRIRLQGSTAWSCRRSTRGPGRRILTWP